MTMRTLGQIRSEKALKVVQEIIESYKDGEQDGFKKLAVGFPTMVLKNGFGQALSFCLAKGMDNGEKKTHDKHISLFEIIAAWLNHAEGDVKIKQVQNTKPIEFMKEISTMAQNDYLMIQQETLRYLEWVKRYADAFCKESESKSS